MYPGEESTNRPTCVIIQVVSSEPRFRLLNGGQGEDEVDDHLELDLPQETLSAIEGMFREFVPGLARYAWLIAADGWAYVFEGAPPSDLTYLMRCLASSCCEAGEEVSGFCLRPTPTLAPFEIRLHVQTLGPGLPQAVLICAPRPEASSTELESAVAAIRPRLEKMVADGLWIVPSPISIELKRWTPTSRA